MAYELIIAEHAEKQIDELAGYLVEELHNLEAAKHFLDELEKVYNRLEENPLQFHLSRDTFLKRSGYREALFATMRYRVVFRIDGTVVYIVGVFHTLERYAIKMREKLEE